RMAGPPEQRGYSTPIAADMETAFRRLVRFELKFIVGFVVVLLLIGGIVAAVVIATNGDDKVTIPDVRGFDNVGVASTFDRAGLAPDFIRLERASDTVTVGRVIKTDPAIGTEVNEGTVVKVTFSCGPPQPGF